MEKPIFMIDQCRYSELIALFDDGSSSDDCSKIAKVAVMLKNLNGGTIPSFAASPVLQTLTMVHSLDLQDLAQDVNGVLTEVSSSGVFFPTPSYTSNVMSSAENLVIAGESYVQDNESEWNEQTVLLFTIWRIIPLFPSMLVKSPALY
jgi:hypothetical protein